MWQYTSIQNGDNCIVFEIFMVSIVDLLCLHETTFFTDEGMFPLFTHLSADYHLIMWQYTSIHMITL
jgi:hypothetical protein